VKDEDKGLVTELCYGYLRLKGRIDYLLSLYLKAPEKLPSRVRLILGLAGYELLFLEKIPAYASVSWAVAGVKKGFGRGLANVANAVLRKLSRLDGHDEGLFKQDNPPINIFWSRYYSCPEWIVNLWLGAYGHEFTRNILEQSITKPPLGIRIDADAADASECFPWKELLAKAAGSGSVILACHPPIIALRGLDPFTNQLLNRITYSRQSYAGQQVILELDPKSWPEPIWDACAGRGGKTFLLHRLGRKVVASDVHLGRIKGLKAEAKRLKSSFSYFVGSVFYPPLKIRPSTILLDVPCSGLGVLSRRPDIKWKRKPEDMQKFISAQSRMLQRAARLLSPGGELIYVTCTLNPDENEGQIKRLIKENKSLHLVRTFQTDENMRLNEFFFGARVKKRKMGS
ncbi:RsmB/NOP family class I SAM-dependent RNA methyltransferase, partial [Desulfovulcanus sp.]